MTYTNFFFHLQHLIFKKIDSPNLTFQFIFFPLHPFIKMEPNQLPKALDAEQPAQHHRNHAALDDEQPAQHHRNHAALDDEHEVMHITEDSNAPAIPIRKHDGLGALTDLIPKLMG